MKIVLKFKRSLLKKVKLLQAILLNVISFVFFFRGEADLVRYDFNGNKTIVEHLATNDIFGEIFYTVTTNNELFVESRSNCTVLFFTYDDIKIKCKNNCEFHKKLLSNLPELFLSEIIGLNMRIELLSKRSIREKLLGYFTIISTKNMSKSFSIPLSLTDLADYLGVDRSAMMRELKSLKDDGIISKSGNKINLLY